jgi:hypothetical protein
MQDKQRVTKQVADPNHTDPGQADKNLIGQVRLKDKGCGLRLSISRCLVVVPFPDVFLGLIGAVFNQLIYYLLNLAGVEWFC